jgi:hypothetical protein
MRVQKYRDDLTHSLCLGTIIEQSCQTVTCLNGATRDRRRETAAQIALKGRLGFVDRHVIAGGGGGGGGSGRLLPDGLGGAGMDGTQGKKQSVLIEMLGIENTRYWHAVVANV